MRMAVDPAPRPEFVYHYTTPPALLGIGISQTLYAGVAEEMNDLREQTIASECCSEELRKHPEAEEFTRAWDDIRGVTHVAGTDLRNVTQFRTSLYTVSFSGARDSLEQWRAYAPTPGSMALGFSLSHLKQAGESQGFWLTPCAYDPTTHLIESRRLVEEFIELLGSTPPDQEGMLAREFHYRVQQLNAIFKDVSFASEQEWRLISGDSQRRDDHKYLATASGLREFRPFKIFEGVDPSQIRISAYFGPNGDHRQMLQTWESLRHHWPNPPGPWEYSTVPFRAQ